LSPEKEIINIQVFPASQFAKNTIGSNKLEIIKNVFEAPTEQY